MMRSVRGQPQKSYRCRVCKRPMTAKEFRKGLGVCLICRYAKEA